MQLSDLPDEIIVRVLFTLFQQTKKITDIISLANTSRRFKKFKDLAYTWRPCILAHVKPDFAPNVLNGIVIYTQPRGLLQFTNLRSLTIMTRNIMMIKSFESLSSLKHLTLIISKRFKYINASKIRDLYNNLNFSFKLKSFKLSSIKPILIRNEGILRKKVIRKEIGNILLKSWDGFIYEFGNLIYIILYLSRATIEFVQIEMLDMSLIFDRAKKSFPFDEPRLISFDTSSVPNLSMWLKKFTKLNKKVTLTINNSFNNSLLLSESNWKSWAVLKNAKTALNEIKRDLKIEE